MHCGCVAVVVTKREHDLGQSSPHTHMGSLAQNYIGAAGVRDLGAALHVNTTLTELG